MGRCGVASGVLVLGSHLGGESPSAPDERARRYLLPSLGDGDDGRYNDGRWQRCAIDVAGASVASLGPDAWLAFTDGWAHAGGKEVFGNEQWLARLEQAYGPMARPRRRGDHADELERCQALCRRELRPRSDRSRRVLRSAMAAVDRPIGHRLTCRSPATVARWRSRRRRCSCGPTRPTARQRARRARRGLAVQRAGRQAVQAAPLRAAVRHAARAQASDAQPALRRVLQRDGAAAAHAAAVGRRIARSARAATVHPAREPGGVAPVYRRQQRARGCSCCKASSHGSAATASSSTTRAGRSIRCSTRCRSSRSSCCHVERLGGLPAHPNSPFANVSGAMPLGHRRRATEIAAINGSARIEAARRWRPRCTTPRRTRAPCPPRTPRPSRPRPHALRARRRRSPALPPLPPPPPPPPMSLAPQPAAREWG